jgi:hypothetical protein
MRDALLHTEPESSHWKRIDRRQYSLRVHHGTKPFGRHAVPDADLDETTTSRSVPGETVAFSGSRLGCRGGETDLPRDVVRQD